ncbi:MAG: hypothetical protein ABL308_08120 [Oceanicaulis sp.]
MPILRAALLSAAAMLAACSIEPQAGAPVAAGATAPGDETASVTVRADHPFTLRLPAPEADTAGLSLQYRRNEGAWTAVEFHDFPLPQRELTLDFGGLAPGAPPPGWTMIGAATLEGADGGVLSAQARGGDGFALYDTLWPLDDFSYAAVFRLAETGPGAALVFGYESPENYARAVFDPEAGAIRVERVENGAARVLAQMTAEIARGVWLTAGVQGEDGVLTVELGDGEAVLELPRPGGLASERLGLHLPEGASAGIRSVEIAGEAATPRVSRVSTQGEAVFGEGETAWPIVIRRFADGALTNEAGDVFDFRLVDASGTPAADAPIRLTLTVPDNHLGGTFVETPGRIGPFEASNGDLYVIMEPAETDNLFMVVKSEDGGRSWAEIDGANRPATGDLEAVDARLVDGALHILHQITEEVVLHVFATSDHPETPDRWIATDRPVAEAEAMSQMASLAARPDGRLTAVFLGDRLYVTEQSEDRAWSPMRPLDPAAAHVTVGPQALAVPGGAVQVAYADTGGTVWLTTLEPGGAPSAPIEIARGAVTGEDDFGAVLPLARLEATGALVIAYRLSDGTLWERRLTGDALSDPRQITPGPVITNPVDSQQVAADLASGAGALAALFIEAETGSIYSTQYCLGGWTPPRLEVSGITGSWVRGAIYRDDAGAPVYRFVYDAGSNGGAGLNRYAEATLDRCG